jgi:hypothetical protein
MKSTFKNTFSKDNVGSVVLLGAMLMTIAAAFTSVTVEAKAPTVTKPATTTTTTTTTNTAKVETLVVTATRLK